MTHLRYLIGLLVLFAISGPLAVGCQDSDDSINRQLDVVYSSPAGEPLKLDFVRPRGDGPFPLVVCIHGGGWRQGSRTEYKDFQTNMAGQGIASASVQYRLAPQATFPAPLDDIKAALEFLLADSSQFKIDASRIIWFGGSAGGHLALLVGLEDRPNYRTRLILNGAGPTDLRTFRSLPTGDDVLKRFVTRNSSELLEDFLGTPDRKADVFKRASPIEHVRKEGPRIVTIHGGKDDIVPLAQAQLLHSKLREIKASERLIVGASGGHDFATWDPKERTDALLALIDEIQKAVKEK